MRSPSSGCRRSLTKGPTLLLSCRNREADVQQRFGDREIHRCKKSVKRDHVRRKREAGSTRDTTRGRHSSIDLTANVEVNKESGSVF